MLFPLPYPPHQDHCCSFFKCRHRHHSSGRPSVGNAAFYTQNPSQDQDQGTHSPTSGSRSTSHALEAPPSLSGPWPVSGQCGLYWPIPLPNSGRLWSCQLQRPVWDWLRPLLMPDLLSSLTHVVPKTVPLETGPTQTSISESVSRDPDQRHLPAFPVPYADLTLLFWELPKPLSSLLPKLPQCGVKLCIFVHPPLSGSHLKRTTFTQL